MKPGWIIIFAAVCSIVASATVRGGGLSTQLGEVVIENLKVGNTYSLEQLMNMTLNVTNTSDHDVNLVMEVLLPGQAELRHGAEPIPGVSWVAVETDRYALGPRAVASSDITISIPEDPKYLGKIYEFIIWSHTVGSSGGGMTLAYGLKSRIIFTIDTQMITTDKETANRGENMCFRLAPQEIYLNDVEPGKVYDVSKRSGIALTLTNPTEEPRLYKLFGRKVSDCKASVASGFEDAPDGSYLTFDADSLVLQPGDSEDVNMYVKFPQGQEFAGRRFQFVVHALTTDGSVTAGVYSRVFVSTKYAWMAGEDGDR